MSERFSRMELLYGKEAMRKLERSRVAVFGIGGVGGYVVEALARSGIGALDLIDHDTVAESNINRQIIATDKTIGRFKAEVAAERIADISPDCRVTVHKTFFLPDTEAQFDFRNYDYVVDAIDTVTGKLAIIMKAKEAGVPVILAMGAGNKIHPALFEVADIYQTSVCPLAKVMRHECRRRGIESLKVVYSKEVPRIPFKEAGSTIPDPAAASPEGTAGKSSGKSAPDTEPGAFKKAVPGSAAFAPSVCGLIIAGEVVNDLTGEFIKL